MATDAKGNAVNQGDIVLVPFTVTAITPGGLVWLESIHEMPVRGGTIGIGGMNAGQCHLLSGFQVADVPEATQSASPAQADQIPSA